MTLLKQPQSDTVRANLLRTQPHTDASVHEAELSRARFGTRGSKPASDLSGDHESIDRTKRSLLTGALADVASGSQMALKQVYDLTHIKLFGICLRICGNDECATEALQDTYLTVWRRAATFDQNRASPMTWLSTIARSRSIDAYRRNSKSRDHVA